MKKHAITAGTAFLVLALVVGMASTVTAETQDDNETTDVNVTVASTTALDVKPDQLTYTDVAVGDRQTVTDNDHGYESVKVENTGSNDIQRIWMNTSFPNSNPFGQGSVSAHNSANFLQIKPLGDETYIRGNNSTYHYVQRYEYFQDNSPLVDLGSFSSSYDAVDVGRIRAGNNEFYFALGYDSGSCDTGSELRIGDTPTTPTSIGTNNFDSSNSDDWTAHNISTTVGTGYGITNESISLALDGSVDGISGDETQEYDVLTKCDGLSNVAPSEPHIILTRYNVEAGNADNLEPTVAGGSGDVVTEVWRSTGSSSLSPGQSFEVDAAVHIPRGVPDGDITEGVLTVYSQAG